MSTKLKNKVIVLLSWALLLQLDHFALAADITKEEDLMTVCPGELVSLTCTLDNVAGGLTRWQVSGPMSCVAVVPHDAELQVQEDVCGRFTVTMISGSSGSTLSSTFQILATEALNSTVVTCLAGGSSSFPQVGNTTLNVINMTSLTTWMANLRTNSLCPVLEWDPLDAPYQRCVIGYTINLNGTVYNTTNTSLSLAGESLSYYCETQTVIVTPLTLNGSLSPDKFTGYFILALHVLGESVRSLSTGEAVAVSVAATFTISISIGLLLGMSLMYCIMCYRNRGHYTVRQQQEESIQPTVPSGPVYEEVTPIQEGIELKPNEAYRLL